MRCSLSIIIPTYNEASTIATAIESATRQEPIEIIISDGNSTDATRAIVREWMNRDPRVLLINEACGRGSQLASGAARATGDVLLFPHSDNLLMGDARNQMEAAGWPIWGGFEQRIDNPQWRYRWLERGNAARVRWTSRVFGDQAMFVHRSAYEQVGGFDSVDLMEDVQISNKLKRITKATLLPGRVRVDPRRWRKRGVVVQTIRNWGIQIAHVAGVPPTTLRNWYG